MKCKSCGLNHKAGHEHLKLSGADAIKMATKKMRKSIQAKKHKKIAEESKAREATESKEVEAKEDKKHKKPKLGSGARFAALSKKVGSPALAAFIGRKKYGAKKFGKLSAQGKK